MARVEFGEPTHHVSTEALAELARRLVAIPSVSGEEKALADWVQRWLVEDAALAPSLVRRFGNCLLVGAVATDRPTVALVGHLDTAPPLAASVRAELVDGFVRGTGAADMKGGVAVMLALAATLATGTWPIGCVWLLYDREESAGRDNGLVTLFEHVPELYDLDLAVLLDPTDNALQLGSLGSITGRFTFHGRAAHSARSWMGDNAVHRAAPLLAALRERPVRRVEVNGLTFRESTACTGVVGGAAHNTIPDAVELIVNHRFAPSAPLDEALSNAMSFVRSLASEADLELMVVAEPGAVAIANPLLDHWRSLVDFAVGPHELTSDVRRFQSLAIDAVCCGPGDPDLSHTRDERVAVASLRRSYDVLARLLTAPLALTGEP